MTHAERALLMAIGKALLALVNSKTLEDAIKGVQIEVEGDGRRAPDATSS